MCNVRKVSRFIVVVVLLGITTVVVFYGVLSYVVVHFIHKLW